MEADSLSKQALAYQPGLLEIKEVVEGMSAFHYETIWKNTDSNEEMQGYNRP